MEKERKKNTSWSYDDHMIILVIESVATIY